MFQVRVVVEDVPYVATVKIDGGVHIIVDEDFEISCRLSDSSNIETDAVSDAAREALDEAIVEALDATYADATATATAYRKSDYGLVEIDVDLHLGLQTLKGSLLVAQNADGSWGMWGDDVSLWMGDSILDCWQRADSRDNKRSIEAALMSCVSDRECRAV